MQNVVEFLKRVADDAKLRKQLGDNPTVEQVISVAKSLGFEFTADDVVAAKAAGASTVELTDADLDQVAGAGFLSIGCKGGGKGGGDDAPEPEDSGSDGKEDTRTPDERLDDLTSGPVNPPGPPGPLSSKTPILC